MNPIIQDKAWREFQMATGWWLLTARQQDALAKRWDRAVGFISQVVKVNGHYRVPSQSRGQVYEVGGNLDGCQCEDSQKPGGHRGVCKHQIAAFICETCLVLARAREHRPERDLVELWK